MDKKTFRLTNKILIPGIVGLVLVLMVLSYLIFALSREGDMIYIHKDGKVIEKVKLSQVNEPYTIDIGTNKIYIEKDGVSMKEANCPDKLCIKQGKKTKDTDAIICLPNKVIIEFKGNQKYVDAVAGAR